MTKPKHGSSTHAKPVPREMAALVNGLLLGGVALVVLCVDCSVLVASSLGCVLVTEVDVLVAVVVGTRGSNFLGCTEIAPALKCSRSAPKTASVELTSSPRKVAL